MKARLPIACLAVGLLLSGAAGLQAHDSPEHVVELLTARMEVVGRRPDLLWSRATEYRVLGRLSQAADDLQEAIKARPDYVQALLDLSRVQVAQSKPRQAQSTIQRALSVDVDASTRAGIRMAHAEILAERGKLDEAILECDRAIAQSEFLDPEWYLTRSEFQYRHGRHFEAAVGLQQGFEKTGNPVLEAEWIEALIDAGLCHQAMRRIGPLMNESRWQASWRIRRGRALLGLGEISRAHSDLAEAIAELNSRLRGVKPDVTLLVERGLAYALLGSEDMAQADLRQARDTGAEAGLLARLSRSLPSIQP